MKPVYKRILLKLSGEALAGNNKTGFDFDVVTDVCKKIKTVNEMGVQVAVVVGGGNFWRGRSSGEMNRVRADHMGMLATTINSLALCDTLEQLGVKTTAMTAIEMNAIADQFTARGAVEKLNNGEVVIFGCGSGCPFFSTDTTAALRAAEIGADVIFKATNVDGVYSDDPKTNKDAKLYHELSFEQVLADHLHVMDSTAATLCMDNSIQIKVFNLNDSDNIIRAVSGEDIGTTVK